jgi:hypothetical protein
MRAVQAGRPEAALLLARAGADVHARDEARATTDAGPAYAIVAGRHPLTALRRIGRLRYVCTQSGNTALDMAGGDLALAASLVNVPEEQQRARERAASDADAKAADAQAWVSAWRKKKPADDAGAASSTPGAPPPPPPPSPSPQRQRRKTSGDDRADRNAAAAQSWMDAWRKERNMKK